MGLLDDAIREHLDLKRRRGADPAEIERAEREALGPVRRNREPGAADDPELDPALGSALDEPDGGMASDLVDEGLYDDDDEAATGEHFLEDDEEYDDEQDPFEDDELRADEPYTDEDDEEYEDEDDEPDAAVEDPHRTQLMSTVDLPTSDEPLAEGEDEDVLEETPEFLQDTPDHDRLWFEQRPPRDFDFDG